MQGHHVPILCILISGANAFSTPTASPSAFQQTAFQQFVFSPNGVCTYPEIFFLADGDSDEITEAISQSTASRLDLEKMAAEGKHIFSMRNVPGEGDCMFQAVALATAASMGLGGNNALLRAISEETRDIVAQIMGSPDGNLLIEGQRLVQPSDLLLSAARQEGITTEQYLDRLRKSGTEGGLYGGGPELTVLSNLLRRPISIYELDISNGGSLEYPQQQQQQQEMRPTFCRIRLAGVFGDRFKDPCLSIPNSAVLSGLQPGAYSWHLHILIVDAGPNEKHACALLPRFCDSP